MVEVPLEALIKILSSLVGVGPAIGDMGDHLGS